jgi:hypothetical protein
MNDEILSEWHTFYAVTPLFTEDCNVSLVNTDQFHHWEHLFKPVKLQGQERNYLTFIVLCVADIFPSISNKMQR